MLALGGIDVALAALAVVADKCVRVAEWLPSEWRIARALHATGMGLATFVDVLPEMMLVGLEKIEGREP